LARTLPGLLALLAPGVGAEMSALAPSIDAGAPYGLAQPALLLYVRMPLAVLGALWLVLAPGLALARRFLRASDDVRRLPFALALSMAVLVPLVTLARFVFGVELYGARFVALAMAAGFVAAWFGASTSRAAGHARAARELGALYAGAVLFVVALTPKFFFECFNGDGAHAFEASRLALHQPLPFWPDGAGAVAGFPGLNSVLFVWPNTWFLGLFGPYECAVRLPFALHLIVLYGTLVAACREGLERVLPPSARALIGAGVVSYGLVMSYSATYDPYCADIGLPATQDTLAMIVFCGAALAYQRGSAAWTFAFAGMTLLASPNGALLLGLWWLAVALVRPRGDWKRWTRLAAVVAAALALYAAAPQVLEALGLPAPGAEHSGGRLLDKFRRLQAWDPQRFLFWIVPAGLYPMLGYLTWRRVDAVARAWMLVSIGAFAVFYALASASLHYYVPAMLLPLVVFWRGRLCGDRDLARPRVLVPCALGAAISVFLATPRSSAVCTSSRDVGATIRVRDLASYARSDASAFRASDLLSNLFTPGWDPSVPDEHYAGSSLAWNFYAQQAAGRDFAPAYELRGGEFSGAVAAFAENSAAKLFVLDEERRKEHVRLQPRKSLGRDLYLVPRSVLFGPRRARPTSTPAPGAAPSPRD
jgi:hypothetical protein